MKPKQLLSLAAFGLITLSGIAKANENFDNYIGQPMIVCTDAWGKPISTTLQEDADGFPYVDLTYQFRGIMIYCVFQRNDDDRHYYLISVRTDQY